MYKPLRKIFVAVLLAALPILAGAEEVKPVPESKVETSAPPASPALTSPAVKGVEPGKTERAIKFGYADILKLGSESVQGKAAKARFEEKSDKYKSQIMAKQKQLEKKKAAIQAKLATLTPEQRAVKAKDFEKKVEEYQKFVQKAEKEMQAFQEEISGKLYQDIEQAAVAYGKANGFTAICVKKDILYLGSGVDVQDVTDAILKLVNEKGQKP